MTAPVVRGSYRPLSDGSRDRQLARAQASSSRFTRLGINFTAAPFVPSAYRPSIGLSVS